MTNNTCTLHHELCEKDGRSYVAFWVLLRECAGESQGGSLTHWQELMMMPLEFNGSLGDFQVSLRSYKGGCMLRRGQHGRQGWHRNC